MSVQVEAWVANKFDLESLRALSDVLNSACPVSELWVWSPDEGRNNDVWTWDGWPTAELLAGDWSLDCSLDAGGFLIHPRRDVLIVHTPFRWRGFLAYADLRHRVHTVTGQIARTLSANDVIWLPDWFLNDYPESRELTLDAVRQYLVTEWGPPQPSLNSIDDTVVQLAEHSSPKVWFQERLA